MNAPTDAPRTPRLILASGSPRRSLLLRLAGIAFTVAPPEVDETPLDDEAPSEYVLRLSEAKANAVARNGDDVVLAADTAVVHDGEIIGKPQDADDAVAILTRLAGSTHSVLTAWTVTDGTEHRFGVSESLVTFNDRTVDELTRYVERTQPFDKAGAYALQGDNGWLVSRVDGARSNVMGLPIRETLEALHDFGIRRGSPPAPGR